MKKRYTAEQIVAMLRDGDAKVAGGSTAGQVCRELVGVSDATYYAWRRKYGRVQVAQLKRLKELQKEDPQLRQPVADLSLDKAILQEALSGDY